MTIEKNIENAIGQLKQNVIWFESKYRGYYIVAQKTEKGNWLVTVYDEAKRTQNTIESKSTNFEKSLTEALAETRLTQG